jgi:hypothetical protein
MEEKAISDAVMIVLRFMTVKREMLFKSTKKLYEIIHNRFDCFQTIK